MGGEKISLLLAASALSGSPPHGRGKATPRCILQQLRGITPAWAGKSRWCARGLTRAQDHPRMGGEKRSQACPLRYCAGSPPHGRGKGYAGVKGRSPFRITPAWAGKSHKLITLCCVHRDHPRMGGEKAAQRLLSHSDPGSPPHGRGKAVKDKAGHLPAGITPAWAGKSKGQSRI